MRNKLFNKKYLLIVLFTSVATIIYSFTNFSSVSNIKTSAQTFINSLNSDQKDETIINFDEGNRMEWSYLPGSRDGIQFRKLGVTQKQLLYKLLSAGLSEQGYEKAISIMKLESTLDQVEGSGSYRDPQKYYLAVYGNSELEYPWALSFEGHHLSLNFTLINDSLISAMPAFFGANPAEIPFGSEKGKRILADEEDIARQLVKSLDNSQIEITVINKRAPSDIITRRDSEVDPLNPSGIGINQLGENQRLLLLNLINTYIENMNEEIASFYKNKIDSSGWDKITFAWAGGFEKGQPHYYRIQGKTFLIEYDNTQNNANHIHSVWRDFNGDFGRDLLKLHYNKSH